MVGGIVDVDVLVDVDVGEVVVEVVPGSVDDVDRTVVVVVRGTVVVGGIVEVTVEETVSVDPVSTVEVVASDVVVVAIEG